MPSGEVSYICGLCNEGIYPSRKMPGQIHLDRPFYCKVCEVIYCRNCYDDESDECTSENCKVKTFYCQNCALDHFWGCSHEDCMIVFCERCHANPTNLDQTHIHQFSKLRDLIGE